MKYKARIEETRVLEFEFNDSEMEDGDDPETAAFELAQSQPQNAWEEIDTWVDVEEVNEL